MGGKKVKECGKSITRMHGTHVQDVKELTKIKMNTNQGVTLGGSTSCSGVIGN